MSKHEKDDLYQRFMKLFIQLDNIDKHELIGMMTAMLRENKYNTVKEQPRLVIFK